MSKTAEVILRKETVEDIKFKVKWACDLEVGERIYVDGKIGIVMTVHYNIAHEPRHLLSFRYINEDTGSEWIYTTAHTPFLLAD